QASRPDQPSSGLADQRPPGHRERSDPDPRPDCGSGELPPSRQVRDVEMTISKPNPARDHTPFQVCLPHGKVRLIARRTELAQQVLTHPRLPVTRERRVIADPRPTCGYRLLLSCRPESEVTLALCRVAQHSAQIGPVALRGCGYLSCALFGR